MEKRPQKMALKLLVFPSESLETYHRCGYKDYFPDYFNPSGMFQKIIVCQKESRPQKQLHQAMEVTSVPDLPGLGILFLLAAGLWKCFRQKPSLVRAYNPLGGGLCAVVCQRVFGIPAVVSLHTPYEQAFKMMPQATLTRLFGRFMIRFVLKRAAQIWVVSRSVAATAALFGAEPAKVLVIPNKVDLHWFALRKAEKKTREAFTFLFVGRLAPVKNLKTLLEAARLLKNQGKVFRIQIVGSGPSERSLQQWSQDNHLSEYVLWRGIIAHSDLPTVFQEADAFVLPSLYEGFGTVLIEAQAAGLAVIASDIDGTKDIVNSDNALLFPAQDAEALAEQMKRLMEDSSLKARLEKSSQENAGRFSSEKISGLERSTYEKLWAMPDETQGWKNFANQEGWLKIQEDYLKVLPFGIAKNLMPGDTLTWDRHARNFFRTLSYLELSGKKVLELGAGRCWSTKYLALQGARCVATDMVVEEGVGLKTARQMTNGLPIHFDLVRCDMNVLPFPQESFEIVFATGAIHHSLDLFKTFQEAGRVLKRRGQLVLANEHCSSWRGREDCSRGDMPGINEHCYRAWRLVFYLWKAGFRRFQVIPDVYFLKKNDYCYSFFAELSRLHPMFVICKLLIFGGVFNLMAEKP